MIPDPPLAGLEARVRELEQVVAEKVVITMMVMVIVMVMVMMMTIAIAMTTCSLANICTTVKATQRVVSK